MKHPKAQIKAIMRMRLFIQLTHIQHLAPQGVGAQAQSHPTGQGLGLFAYSLVCVFHGSGGNHLQECGLCLTVITSLVFNSHERTHPLAQFSHYPANP